MKRPTVERYGDGWRICIYPGCYLKVWTEDRAEGGVMIIESDFPSLKRLDGIDRDHFELPVRMLPQ
jgi:hypothetical protein